MTSVVVYIGLLLAALVFSAGFLAGWMACDWRWMKHVVWYQPESDAGAGEDTP